ncbi:MAG TPA: AAA family ATPase [Actinophytocola sp.]|uniref:AAA family ATPase n=1 Tax=Actinophytocola sp. TaxID=1872138 RepID=UPI002DDCBF8D|nr:AAA family ATPase [Actinophytocola sp.]HEV2781797.1 AAA family ATPase [Actinophytocola sp.]
MGKSDDSRKDLTRAKAHQGPAHTTLILVGRFGSGKSTVGIALAKRTGLPYLEIGDIVRREAATHGHSALEHARRKFTQGQHLAFVSMAADDAKKVGLPCIVGGPRRPDELDYLQEALHPTVAIALSLSGEERERRLAERDRGGEPEVERGYRDVLEENWGISQTLAACDFSVASTGQPDLVVEQCLELWMAADRQVNNSREN